MSLAIVPFRDDGESLPLDMPCRVRAQFPKMRRPRIQDRNLLQQPQLCDRPILYECGINMLGLFVVHNEIAEDRLPQSTGGTVASIGHRLIGWRNSREAVTRSGVECSRRISGWVDVPEHRARRKQGVVLAEIVLDPATTAHRLVRSRRVRP